MQKPESTNTARIIELANTFYAIADHPAVEAWDPDQLDQWAKVASHGEKLAVQFILRVWNQYENWGCGRFDVFEAYATWDDRHWQAFRAWADKPFML